MLQYQLSRNFSLGNMARKMATLYFHFYHRYHINVFFFLLSCSVQEIILDNDRDLTKSTWALCIYQKVHISLIIVYMIWLCLLLVLFYSLLYIVFDEVFPRNEHGDILYQWQLIICISHICHYLNWCCPKTSFGVRNLGQHRHGFFPDRIFTYHQYDS